MNKTKANLVLVILFVLIIYSTYRLTNILSGWDQFWLGVFGLAILIGDKIAFTLRYSSNPELSHNPTTHESIVARSLNIEKPNEVKA